MTDVEANSPAPKKCRLDEDAEFENASPTSHGASDSQTKSSITSREDEVIVLDEDGEADAEPSEPKSVCTTPKTPGSKRKREEERLARLQEKIERQARREEERAKKEAERLKKEQAKLDEKLDKERQAAEKRDKKRQEEEAARAKKEAIKKEQEEARRLKLEAEEERKKQRLAEIEAKRAKKKAEEEEKEAKRREAEEKKRAELEKEARKKEKQSQLLLQFVVKKEKNEPKYLLPDFQNPLFQAFEIKDGWTLAPIHRRRPMTKEEVANFWNNSVDDMEELRARFKAVKPFTRSKKNSMKAKLFQFHDNYRPPYYGTWRKKSKVITPRTPFKTNEPTIDYDYDSDEEWENEPVEGDECRSDEEEEKASDDEDDSTSDSFVVEHGYLSNNEGLSSDDEPQEECDDQDRKKRLAQLNVEWKEERQNKEKKFRKKNLEVIKYGVRYTPPGEDVPEFIRREILSGITLTYVKTTS